MTTPPTSATNTPSRAKVDELHKDFAFNDANKDGLIGLEEFRELLEDLEADMSERESRIGFHEIDTDHDGAIDFKEFVAWWTSD